MLIHWLVAALALMAGCVSQPEYPPVAPVGAQAAAAATEPPVTTVQAAAPATEPPVTTVQAASKAGYKLVNRNGVAVYCKEQLKTGSHLRKETICLTAAELEAAREASLRNLEQMQRPVTPPQGT